MASKRRNINRWDQRSDFRERATYKGISRSSIVSDRFDRDGGSRWTHEQPQWLTRTTDCTRLRSTFLLAFHFPREEESSPRDMNTQFHSNLHGLRKRWTSFLSTDSNFPSNYRIRFNRVYIPAATSSFFQFISTSRIYGEFKNALIGALKNISVIRLKNSDLVIFEICLLSTLKFLYFFDIGMQKCLVNGICCLLFIVLWLSFSLFAWNTQYVRV